MPATSGPTPVDVGPPMPDDIKYTPLWLRVVAGWGWRLLVLAGVVLLFWTIGTRLSQIVVPLMLALLITSGLGPFTSWMERKGLPRWAAALIALLSMILIFSGLLTLVGTQIASQWSDLTTAATKGFTGLITWLGTGPFQVSPEQMETWIDQGIQALQDSRNQIASGVASAGSRVGAFFAGLATCLFAAFFFLKDGRGIAGAFEKLIPTYALRTIEPAMRGGWTSLAAYVRAAVTVAGIDGVGAGLGALALGSNLWVAIMAFTFVASFVPLLGATIAGAVATVVVLVTLGWVKAVIMLVIFVLVMSIEANVLQPLLLGRAVEIHPLLVLLGISAGAIIAGISGALFAIPLVAFVSGAIRGVEGIFADGERGKVSIPWRSKKAKAAAVAAEAALAQAAAANAQLGEVAVAAADEADAAADDIDAAADGLAGATATAAELTHQTEDGPDIAR